MATRSSSGFRYRAFISYSHQDKTWADWLHKALETYVVPKRLVGQSTAAGPIPARLAPIFRDREELASATDLGRKVSEALEQSANLIVICSPRSAASRWVAEEVLAFKRLGRSERIFCLIVDGEPDASSMPGREAEECFASTLRYRVDAAGALTDVRTEPIAADARAGKDGKTNAKLKLVAGLLDVDYDALKQRELQRRHRRLAAITALALIVMTVTTALAIAAVFARNAAVVAQASAERRQKQAEDLVGFMLGDLGDKLGEVHRLDIMQSVDDKAMAYFATLPSSDASDAALALRVTALEKIGSVRMDQGKTPAALLAYQSASTLAAELAQRAPADVDRQAAYGDSLKWVGQAYWYQGDLDSALRNFEAAGAALRKAAAAKPDDSEFAVQLAAAQNNAGHVLETRGDFAAAKIRYDSVLKIYDGLRTREPGNSRWLSYQGDAYDNLGKLALEQGQLAPALAAYRANQRIKATLAAQDPNDHPAQLKLVVANAILGRTLALCGDIDAALRATGAAVDSAKALTQFDPSFSSWQDYYALYSQQLGGLLRQSGQLDQAAAADDEALRVLNALTAKDPTDSEWPPDLAQAQLENARLQLARNAGDAAKAALAPALAIIQKLREKNPDARSPILLAAQADLLLGQIAAQTSDAATAQRNWAQARDALAPALKAGDDPNFLAAYAEALLRLDQTDAARPVVEKLGAMGYRAPDFVALTAAKHLAYPVNEAFARQMAQAMQ
ncbi:MAG: toll/interleukin-1 receptor domain-containing protein [Dokdonella sp.]